MPETNWPANRRLIGTKIQRLDGPVKATGQAKYGFDINRKGMLHAMILRSPHAHARITSIDTSAAEKTPGFKAVLKIKDAGQEVYFAGDEILAIAADTEEHCADCLRAVKIVFQPLPFVTTEAAALKDPKKGTVPNSADGNVKLAGQRNAGNADQALQAAEAVVEGVYAVPVQCHTCLESHGMVAEWEGDNLTVWASTQAVAGVAQGLEQHFRNKQVANVKCRCITHYMGGGYGSKFTPGVEGLAVCELARIAKAPVKLFLDRAEEQTTGGNRPSATAKIKIGGTKDGKITAFQADSYGTPGGGAGAGAVDAYQALLPYIYTIPNLRLRNETVRINAGDRRALRAPVHPQACFLTESAVDDFCNRIGMDPIKVRLGHLPTDHRKAIYEKELDIARQLSDWDKKWHPAGKGPGQGPVKHGMGVALHTWGGGGRADNDVTVTITSNGSVRITSSTQDLGTGERTVLPIVVAEVLGLEVKDIASLIGESQYGRSTGSGGSTTCPGTAPAALNAAAAARDDLFKKVAMRLGEKPEDLKIDPAKPGKIVGKAKEYAWKEACARLGMDTAVGQGNWTPGLSSQGVGGVQIAEVTVDTESGVVHLKKIYAVQDCGLIINKLGCESQVAGGVIMGIHYAMFEDRIMDEATGRQVNPDLEFYKLAGMKDIPEIVVHMHDMPERGVIGIGEPPTIGTAAAIGNAICNAIGVRVARTPFSPDKVLAALAQKGGA